MGLLGNLKLVSWHKRTLCHPVWSVIILVIKQIRLPLCSRPILLRTRIHDFKLVSVKRRLRTVVFPMEIGTLSIDNETCMMMLRNRGRLGQGFHFQWGKQSLSSAASQPHGGFFFQRSLSCYSLVMASKDLRNLHLISYDNV